MESDIIIVTDSIEIHPAATGDDWSVVRDGRVYGTYTTLAEARQVAKALAGNS